MSKPVRFTQHARRKFDDLAAMGFVVTEAQVIDTVRNPDHVDESVDPPVAQKAVSQRHVLRVVFVEDEETTLVITFYPGRRTRYESQNAV